MAQTSISPRPLPGTAPHSTLTTLPLDVLFQLATHLEYGDLLRLKQTCQAFHCSLDPDTLLPHSSKVAFYQEVERFPRYRAHLACFKCFRLLHARKSFIDSHRTGSRGKYGQDPSCKSKRACWDCIIRHKLLPQGTGASKDGLRWYLCHRCESWRLQSQRCRKAHRQPIPQGAYPTTAAEIHEQYERLKRAKAAVKNGTGPGVHTWIQCPPCNTIAMHPDRWVPFSNEALRLAPFEKLPVALHKKILSLLPYLDLIALSRASKYCRLLLPDPALACGSLYSLQATIWRKCSDPPVPADSPVLARKSSTWSGLVPCPGCWRQRPVPEGFPGGEYGGYDELCWGCVKRRRHPSHFGDYAGLGGIWGGFEEWKGKRGEVEKCRWCEFFKVKGVDCEGCVDNAEVVKAERDRVERQEREEAKREGRGKRGVEF
ncbi:hypothetical protein QBC41DRAFT_300074 [Cercophora samala]|uniref:F-box domain-containing protein n=1 Tax=Cercophora samala TaxID=330535 RepID=A0AA39ZIS5_9PEZI|nr:hypothetical protein QBC41DRAFT_300074 [Cercophora samala]